MAGTQHPDANGENQQAGPDPERDDGQTGPEQPPIEAEPVVSVADPEVEALRKKIAELEAQVEQLQGQTRHYAQAYDRARNEFAAARDRMQRETERTLKRDQAKAVSGLLGVLDSLDRSLESVRSQAAGQGFVDGVQVIRSQFEAALSELGLQRFDGVGEVFDPNRHQALTTMPVTDPAQDGRVVHGVASGAVVADEVVRPATVVVGKYTAEKPD